MNAKFISLAFSLLLATMRILPACFASENPPANLPAESLVIKGFHLGMNPSEADAALKALIVSQSIDPKNCELKTNGEYYGVYCNLPTSSTYSDPLIDFIILDDHLSKINFNVKVFNAENVVPATFIESFLSFYKISSYFNKVVNSDPTFNSNIEDSYCFIDGFNVKNTSLHCASNITGLSISIKKDDGKFYKSGKIVISIERYKTPNEKEQDKKKEEEEKQKADKEAAKGMKFN